MGWIKVAGKALEYAGKLAQAEGFEEWANQQGKTLIKKVALQQGYKILGKQRAKRQLWEELQLIAASDALKAAIQAEADDYQRLVGWIAEKGSNLPRSRGYRPVVTVPRFLVNVFALDNTRKRLGQSDELGRLKGEALKDYFFRQLVRELDKAMTSARPSPRDPFPSHGNWFVVGYDGRFRWRANTESGHYFLYEPYGEKMSRSDRHEIEDKMKDLAVSLGRMSAEEKEAILSPFSA
jgi:hypothetical protein